MKSLKNKKIMVIALVGVAILIILIVRLFNSQTHNVAQNNTTIETTTDAFPPPRTGNHY